MSDNLRGSETRENDCNSQWPGRVREGVRTVGKLVGKLGQEARIEGREE